MRLSCGQRATSANLIWFTAANRDLALETLRNLINNVAELSTVMKKKRKKRIEECHSSVVRVTDGPDLSNSFMDRRWWYPKLKRMSDADSIHSKKQVSSFEYNLSCTSVSQRRRPGTTTRALITALLSSFAVIKSFSRTKPMNIC